MGSTMISLVAIKPEDAADRFGRRRTGRLPLVVALPILGLISAGLWIGTIDLVRFVFAL